MNIVSEIVANGFRCEWEARGPFANDVLDVREAVIAGLSQVFDELLRSGVGSRERFRTDSPDGSDPGQAGAAAPLVGEIKPMAGADRFFELRTDIEGNKSGVADENGGVRQFKHREGVGFAGNEGGLNGEKFAKEDVGVDEGTARGFIACDRTNRAECNVRVGCVAADDELNGADVVKGGDNAVGDDGEVRSEGSDRDEAEVGAGGEEFVGTE